MRALITGMFSAGLLLIAHPAVGQDDPSPRPAPDPQTQGSDVDATAAQADTEQAAPEAANENDVVNQLQLLRQQEGDAEARQEALQDAQAQHAAAAQQALQTVGSAYQVMSYGSEDVAEALSQASSALSGPAQSYVQAAQAALDNEDLYTARQCLQSALVVGNMSQSSPAVPVTPQ